MFTYVAGHKGMVGSAVTKKLRSKGDFVVGLTHDLVDLTRQKETESVMAVRSLDRVILAAARVGGIDANSLLPADFIYQNLAISTNVIHGAYLAGITRLLYLGSTCVYPRMDTPIKESDLLTGPLEPTNEAYAIAKIAGIKMCQHYRKQYGVTYHSIMPTNLYGPGDNYKDGCHVIPALIRRFYEAKMAGDSSVTVWGDGTPLREFLHVDDLADGILCVLSLTDPPDIVNIGSGEEITIKNLAQLIAGIVGYTGKVEYSGHSNGTPRKLCDSSLIRELGWKPKIGLKDGLESTIARFIRRLT